MSRRKEAEIKERVKIGCARECAGGVLRDEVRRPPKAEILTTERGTTLWYNECG